MSSILIIMQWHHSNPMATLLNLKKTSFSFRMKAPNRIWSLVTLRMMRMSSRVDMHGSGTHTIRSFLPSLSRLVCEVSKSLCHRPQLWHLNLAKVELNCTRSSFLPRHSPYPTYKAQFRPCSLRSNPPASPRPSLSPFSVKPYLAWQGKAGAVRKEAQ